MHFVQIAPPAYLQDHVRYFWTLEQTAPPAEPGLFRAMADGCPGMIFQPSGSGTFCQAGKPLPETFLYGQSTRYLELELQGQFRTIGVFFYPHAVNAVFGLDAESLTNGCLDLNGLAARQGFHLSEQLSAAPSTEARIALIAAYLLHLIRRNGGRQDELMHTAMDRILRTHGCTPLKELQERLQLSERSFERRFRQYTGMTPKLFSRICRFQASLRQLRDGRYDKLSDIAFEREYADQSHFIRAFNEFAGCPPLRYRKTAAEVAGNLAALQRR